MKVNKHFAPVTIKLEYEEDLEFFKNVLRMARELHCQRRGFFSLPKNNDSFYEKCLFMEKRLS